MSATSGTATESNSSGARRNSPRGSRLGPAISATWTVGSGFTPGAVDRPEVAPVSGARTARAFQRLLLFELGFHRITAARPRAGRGSRGRGAPTCARRRCTSEGRGVERSASRSSSCRSPALRRSRERASAIPHGSSVRDARLEAAPKSVARGTFVGASGNVRAGILLHPDGHRIELIDCSGK